MRTLPYQPREPESSTLVWLLRTHLDAFLERCRSTYEAGPSLPEEEARLSELQGLLGDERVGERCREELKAFLATVNERKRFPRALKKALAQ